MCYFLRGSPFLRGERREGRQGGLPFSGVMNDLMEACFDIGILTGVDSAELQVFKVQFKKMPLVANNFLPQV